MDELAARQLEHVVNDLLDVERLRMHFSLHEQKAQAPDDLSGDAILFPDIREDLPKLV